MNEPVRPEVRTFCVYKHTAPNGKCYIGITCQLPKKRWKNGTHYNKNEYFFRAILKYGWDNFSHEILATGLTKEEAEREEIRLIAEHRSADRDFGYNIELGGNHHYIAASTRRKLAEANRGRVYTQETREKLRRISLGNRNAVGCKRSEDFKDNLRRLKSKVVIQLHLDGREVGRYTSLADAEAHTGISKGNICECIKAKRSHAGGYKWRYAE